MNAPAVHASVGGDVVEDDRMAGDWLYAQASLRSPAMRCSFGKVRRAARAGRYCGKVDQAGDESLATVCQLLAIAWVKKVWMCLVLRVWQIPENLTWLAVAAR